MPFDDQVGDVIGCPPDIKQGLFIVCRKGTFEWAIQDLFSIILGSSTSVGLHESFEAWSNQIFDNLRRLWFAIPSDCLMPSSPLMKSVIMVIMCNSMNKELYPVDINLRTQVEHR